MATSNLVSADRWRGTIRLGLVGISLSGTFETCGEVSLGSWAKRGAAFFQSRALVIDADDNRWHS